MKRMNAKAARLRAHIVDGIDLMLDLATLGEYGLEPAGGATDRGQAGCNSGWEAPAPARRRGCDAELHRRHSGDGGIFDIEAELDSLTAAVGR